MRSRTPDRLCAEAVGFARAAAVEAAGEASVGEHLAAVADGDRVVTHFFACRDIAYRGWRWAVTVARASRAKVVTLDETVLLPGSEAVLAPQWVPWSERLRPGDMGPGDLLPTDADDLRLEPGLTGADQLPPNSPLAEEPAPSGAPEETAAAEGAETRPGPAVPEVARIAAVAGEIGMGRARVLSRHGLLEAAERWDEEYGARTAMAQAAPAPCVSCGFLLPLAGSLRQAFGICGNAFSPADGHVVSLAYGCGGHSEAAVMPKPPKPAEPVIDETRVDVLPLRPEPAEGSVEDSTPPEELGHS